MPTLPHDGATRTGSEYSLVLGLVGPKAASLCALSRLGMRVPRCFFVATAAFTEHLATNGLRLRISSLLNSVEARAGGMASTLAEIRQLVCRAPLADSLGECMAASYNRLGESMLAVRSSATAEDLPGHSFAGQYETILGVKSLEGCLEAIKRCWASLWTERAYEYRRRSGIDHEQVKMAVIVQELVPAEASGVLFTADPTTGQVDRMVIEACPGLGEALVLGRARADRFVVSKSKLKIVAQDIAEERATVPAIDLATVKRLAKVATQVERRFGCPQDMEWAVTEGEIYVLQSRPITTLGQASARVDSYVWSSFPAKEVMPDVVTPIMRSFIDGAAGGMFDLLLKRIGVDRLGVPLHGYHAGRIYFNASFWAAVIKRLAGSKRIDFACDVGSNPALVAMARMFNDATVDDLPRIKAGWMRFMARLPILIPAILWCTPKRGQSILAEAKATSDRWERLDLNSMSTEQLACRCEEIVVVFCDIIGHANYLFGAMAAYPALQWVCAKWLSDRTYAGRLMAGMGNMDDAQAAMDLWMLAVEANKRTEIKEAILAERSWRDIEAELSRLSQGDGFLRAWNEFMTQRGHHCRAELELANPRWSELPDYVLGLVRGYLSCLDKASPLENHQRSARERRELEVRCRRKLRNPVKRMLFNRLVIRAQEGAVFRENIKSEIIRLFAATRRLLLELGNRLHADDVFAHPNDVFFLNVEELQPTVCGQAEFDVRAVIAERRAEYDKWNSISPPDLIVGQFDPETYVPDEIDTDAKILKGLAVSPGVATGRARVILRTDSHTRLEAGEILVAPFTDPGWTPYFMPAAGIVMNQGSLLSHGSIVARELGIPAVTNVGHATELIKTGQTVQVDGNQGIVRILS